MNCWTQTAGSPRRSHRGRESPQKRVSSLQDFFSTHAYLDYLFDSDAATPSLYLFISQVSQFIGNVPVWEGVAPGNTLKTSHQPPGGFDAYLQQECRRPGSPAWQDAEAVFGRERSMAMYEAFQAELQQELRHYPDTSHGVSQFIVRNRSRNRTSINPLKVYEARTHSLLSREDVLLVHGVSDQPGRSTC